MRDGCDLGVRRIAQSQGAIVASLTARRVSHDSCMTHGCTGPDQIATGNGGCVAFFASRLHGRIGRNMQLRRRRTNGLLVTELLQDTKSGRFGWIVTQNGRSIIVATGTTRRQLAHCDLMEYAAAGPIDSIGYAVGCCGIDALGMTNRAVRPCRYRRTHVGKATMQRCSRGRSVRLGLTAAEGHCSAILVATRAGTGVRNADTAVVHDPCIPGSWCCRTVQGFRVAHAAQCRTRGACDRQMSGIHCTRRSIQRRMVAG